MTHQEWQYIEPRWKPFWMLLYMGWDVLLLACSGYLLHTSLPWLFSFSQSISLILVILQVVRLSTRKYPWSP